MNASRSNIGQRCPRALGPLVAVGLVAAAVAYPAAAAEERGAGKTPGGRSEAAVASAVGLSGESPASAGVSATPAEAASDPSSLTNRRPGPLARQATPGPNLSMDGVVDSPMSVVPPDPDLAAGPGRYGDGRVIMVTNRDVQIWDKLENVKAGPTGLGTMFSAASDPWYPRVLYDQHSERFFIVCLDGTTAGSCTMHIAFSSNSAPNNLTSDWTFKSGTASVVVGTVASTYAVSPAMGADADYLYVTTNQWGTRGGRTKAVGSNVRIFNKSQLLAGTWAPSDNPQNLLTNKCCLSIQPAHVFGTTDWNGFYLISSCPRSDRYRLWNVDYSLPGPPVASTQYLWDRGTALPGAPQKGTAVVLDTMLGAVQSAVYRNDASGAGHLYCCLTGDMDPDGTDPLLADGRTEVVWKDIDTRGGPPNAPRIVQNGIIDGTGADASNAWTYVPSLAVDEANTVAIGYTQSSGGSGGQFPSIYYAVHTVAEPAGKCLKPATGFVGPGYYDSSSAKLPEPWGEYSAMVIDPDPDEDCFWMASEYAFTSAVAASDWGTRIIRFCTGKTGACCFGKRACADLTQADCTAAAGSTKFRGVGTRCPTNNVGTNPHFGTTVVHWTDSARDCETMPLRSRGGRWDAGFSDCCVAHAGPGCDEPTCEAQVCAIDPYCCDVVEGEWDETCAEQALVYCEGLCPEDLSDCCVSHGTPGCDDPTCEAQVCAIDPYCCDVVEGEWDDTCADEALEYCGDLCVTADCIEGELIDAWMSPPSVSDCCEEHSYPGCDDLECSALVCAWDPYCCEEMWDSICVETRWDLCEPETCDHYICHEFGIDPGNCPPECPGCSPPIPEDFFDYGSDAFVGAACLQGEALGETPYGYYAAADTLIRRPPYPGGDPFDRCEVPSGEERVVTLDVVELNLKSMWPIWVTYGGRSPEEEWDVSVSLSDYETAVSGELRATKTHCNGGTYTTTLYVQPKLIFTKVSDPSEWRLLDTGDPYWGVECPVILEQPPDSWVTEADPDLNLDTQWCTDFHPGIDEPDPSTDCDCQPNLILDQCDIEEGYSSDCDNNGVPDECQENGDGDTIVDACDNCPNDTNPDQANTDGDGYGNVCDLCPLVGFIDGDQDADGVYDEYDNCPCDANMDQADSDGDGIGDVCDVACLIPPRPVPEPTVPDTGFGTRQRYPSFSGGTPGGVEATRVTWMSGPMTGMQMWVGEPRLASESSGDSGPTPPPAFWTAALQCEPYVTDWSLYPSVHVYHAAIGPSKTYDVQMVDARDVAYFAHEACYSNPLTINTSGWGDVGGVFDGCQTMWNGYMDCWNSPDGDADFDDITAMIDKFKNRPGAPHKLRADIAPQTPDQVIDFVDIPWEVDAFRGLPYPWPKAEDPCAR